MVLIIDNYDSFTYNIAQLVGILGKKFLVVKNDEITLRKITRLKPAKIIISPGPCTPRESGISNDVIRSFAGAVPILGICLGHQCIASVFGAKIVPSKQILHGKTCLVSHNKGGIYRGIGNPFQAMRYNSLTVDPQTIPPQFEVTSWSGKEVMGIRHKNLHVEGVQFHPESYRTPCGTKLLRNFLL